jgi:hypothetical protein
LTVSLFQRSWLKCRFHEWENVSGTDIYYYYYHLISQVFFLPWYISSYMLSVHTLYACGVRQNTFVPRERHPTSVNTMTISLKNDIMLSYLTETFHNTQSLWIQKTAVSQQTRDKILSCTKFWCYVTIFSLSISMLFLIRGTLRKLLSLFVPLEFHMENTNIHLVTNSKTDSINPFLRFHCHHHVFLPTFFQKMKGRLMRSTVCQAVCPRLITMNQLADFHDIQNGVMPLKMTLKPQFLIL